MKKKLMIGLLITVMCFMLVGCGNNEIGGGNIKNNKTELDKINNKIIEYFSTDNVPLKDNIGFNYVDMTNNIVIVGLKDNSKEQQEKFKELVVDSKYIKFVQGENFVEYKTDN